MTSKKNHFVSRRNFLYGASVIASASAIPKLANGQSLPLKQAAHDIVQMGVLALSKAIHNRSVSCREVMEAYLNQIERVNPKVNAIISLRPRDLLVKAANQADEDLAKNIDYGLFHGIPQAVKDLAETKGIVTTYGSALYKNNIPNEDAIIVERVKKSGAIIIGKTNSPEFGLGSNTYNQVFGITSNAYNQNLSAGGSSGGAAVSLACHMLPVADGSDMMGSLRNPAGWNNVFGFRPNFGRVPAWPSKSLYYEQLGYEGPMGRSVVDAALLLSVQAGFDARVPLSLESDPHIFAQSLDKDFKKTKIGWLADMGGYLTMEDGVLELCEKALGHFKTIGCDIELVTPDFDLHKVWQTWITLRSTLVAKSMESAYNTQEKRKLLKPELIWEIEKGRTFNAQDVFEADAIRSQWYGVLHQLFQKYDFLILPSAQIFPFNKQDHWPKEINGKKMDTYHRWMEVVIYASLAGIPVGCVPAGFTTKGQLNGLQVMGPVKQDLNVLKICHAYELASGFSKIASPLA